MDVLTRVLLTVVYIFILPVRLLRILLGRDTLRLRTPVNAASYWVISENNPDPQSYFSEESVAEGRRARLEGGEILFKHGAARWFTAVLRLIARLYASSRETRIGSHPPVADREQGIPDEIYTLW